MATTKPETLFYVVIKTVKKPVKTKTISIYRDGVPQGLVPFAKWLKKAIEEKVKK